MGQLACDENSRRPTGASRVVKLITIGTPHYGSMLAWTALAGVGHNALLNKAGTMKWSRRSRADPAAAKRSPLAETHTRPRALRPGSRRSCEQCARFLQKCAIRRHRKLADCVGQSGPHFGCPTLLPQ